MTSAGPGGDACVQVHVLDDFAAQAAERFVAWCAGQIGERGRIHVALTGGRTAREFHQALVQPEVLGGLDVGAIDFYQGDERPVGPTSPESNWGVATETLLDPAGVPAANRHRMCGEAADLGVAAREYEQLLYEHLPRHGGVPAFDLLLLGMGPDGHTASLFPGTAALAETRRLVVANPVAKLGVTRLTITYPVIQAAGAVWIIASGEPKANAVYRAVELGDVSLPVTKAKPQSGPLVWLLDRAAGGKLSSRVISPWT